MNCCNVRASASETYHFLVSKDDILVWYYWAHRSFALLIGSLNPFATAGYKLCVRTFPLFLKPSRSFDYIIIGKTLLINLGKCFIFHYTLSLWFYSANFCLHSTYKWRYQLRKTYWQNSEAREHNILLRAIMR